MKSFSPNKDLNKFANEAVEAGWSIRTNGSNHLAWSHPSGAKFSSSLTPSCEFAIKKIRADLRRALRRVGIQTRPLTPFQPYEEKDITMNTQQKPTLIKTDSASHKAVIHLQTARVRLNELVASGKTPEDAVKVLLSAYTVQTGLGRVLSADKLVTLAGRKFTTTRKPASKTDRKPAPKSVAAVPKNQDTDSVLAHIRNVISLPFDKAKKIEIIFDLLDKLL